MKKLLLTIAFIFALAASAVAQSMCRVTLNVQTLRGPDSRATLTVFRIILNGSSYSNQRQTFRTDTNGDLIGADGGVGLELPQSSVAFIYANVPGFDANPNSGTPYQVPTKASATIYELQNATTLFRALGDLVYGGVDGLATRLPAGANGRCLVMVAGIPAWTVCPGGGGGGGVWGTITGTLSDQSDLQAALDLKANTSALAAVALSGDYADLLNLPALGTAAALNVPASGDAASGEVVKGDDTRLTDARTPTAHTHTFASLTSKPTTLSGYGINDAQPLDQDLTDITALTGDGLLRKTSGVWAMDSAAYLTGNQNITLSGDVTGSGATAITTTINNLALSKLAALSANRALASDGSGVITTSSVTDTELGHLSGVTSAIQTQLNGKQATGNYITALTGDVTASGPGSVAATIANQAVTYAKIQNVSATQRLLGRNSAGAGVTEELTASTVLDWLGSTRGSILYRGASGWAILTPGTSGHVLTSNGAGADPSYQASAGGGSPGGSDTQLQRNNAGVFGGISGATSDGTNVVFGSGNLRATSPRLTTSILDSNGNAIVSFSPTASATTSFQITNNTTGNGVTIEPAGGGTNEAFTVKAKGASSVIIGTATRVSPGGGGAGGPGQISSPQFFAANDASNSYTTKISYNGGVSGATDPVVLLGSTTPLGWGNGANLGGSFAHDVGLIRSALGVMRLHGGGTSSSITSTGTGTFSVVGLTPAQITSDQNNYSPGAGWFHRWSSDASRNVTGFLAGQDGQIAEIWNIGSNNIVLQHENASSSAANRFLSSTGADLTLTPNKCAIARYDNSSSRWRVYLCN